MSQLVVLELFHGTPITFRSNWHRGCHCGQVVGAWEHAMKQRNVLVRASAFVATNVQTMRPAVNHLQSNRRTRIKSPAWTITDQLRPSLARMNRAQFVGKNPNIIWTSTDRPQSVRWARNRAQSTCRAKSPVHSLDTSITSSLMAVGQQSGKANRASRANQAIRCSRACCYRACRAFGVVGPIGQVRQSGKSGKLGNRAIGQIRQSGN